jgi:insertion element IS1 protein InsB
MECKKCGLAAQKWGRQRNGSQRYYCKACRKSWQTRYTYQALAENIDHQITALVKESVGVRGIGRILKIAVSTVIRRIKSIAQAIAKPPVPLNRTSFEMDEVRTYIGKKEDQYWVAYALCSETKKVIDFSVGKRSKRTLKMVVNTLLLSGVKMIKTDRLNIYRSLIPAKRHVSNAYNINHIERNNLNLRTHLKRLSRRTICFSKSLTMLDACLRIYFWSSYSSNV